MPNFVWIGIGMWVQELQELPTLVILPGYVWLYIVVYANHDEIWHAKVYHKTRICMPNLAQIGDAGGYSSPKDVHPRSTLSLQQNDKVKNVKIRGFTILRGDRIYRIG